MQTKSTFSLWEVVHWTRTELFILLVYNAIIVALYKLAGWKFIDVPWTPIALVGTAVAFLLGFQNNSAYGRIWEARKIWGGIVNSSRTWGMKVQDMVTNKVAAIPLPEEEIRSIQKVLIHRHVAWLNALRHAMRQPKSWENFRNRKSNREWQEMTCIPEQSFTLAQDLQDYLSPEEFEYVMSKNNKAAACLYLQSHHIRRLEEKGYIWEFAFLELENLLEELFTLQGQSERIKNFPYPRQFFTMAWIFTFLFILAIPLGVVSQFEIIGNNLYSDYSWANHFIWLSIPFCAVVSWIFLVLLRVGTTGENPFEGSPNDVPISAISRGIEIDMRQLFDEDKNAIPDQFPIQNHIQM